jgi:hypothetical protein
MLVHGVVLELEDDAARTAVLPATSKAAESFDFMMHAAHARRARDTPEPPGHTRWLDDSEREHI